MARKQNTNVSCWFEGSDIPRGEKRAISPEFAQTPGDGNYHTNGEGFKGCHPTTVRFYQGLHGFEDRANGPVICYEISDGKIVIDDDGQPKVRETIPVDEITIREELRLLEKFKRNPELSSFITEPLVDPDSDGHDKFLM